MTTTDQPFDLRPTQEQQIAIDALTRFAAERMRPDAQQADLRGSLPDGWLNEVAQLGLPLLNIPESCGGGGGRSAIGGVLVAETLAHGDMAMAIAALAPVSFVNVLVDQGSEEQHKPWLAALLAEDFVGATLAVAEPGLQADPLKPATSARRNGGDWLLDGAKLAVPLGCDAGLMLITATDSDSGEPAAFVVEADSKGLKAQADRWMGLCALDLAAVQLDKVRLPERNRLGSKERPFDLPQMLASGRIGIAALATGVCQAVMDYCVPYCNEREAFGEPISHRQAVAFKLADIATETECMRLLSWRAAGLADRQDAAGCIRAAALAHRFAAEHGMEIGSDSVQLLGGHGFTREHPVELWYRNLRSVETLEAATIA